MLLCAVIFFRKYNYFSKFSVINVYVQWVYYYYFKMN